MRISHPGALVHKMQLPSASADHQWDGAGARDRLLVHAGGDLSKPAVQAKYKKCFLAMDGDPAAKSSYKLPFCDVIDGKVHVVPKGLAAAKAALHGARSGVKLPDKEKSTAESKVGKELATEPEDLDYAVTKRLDEERYTFGPLFTPGEIDAHGEYTQTATLTKAMRKFVAAGNRSVNKQHNRDAPPIGQVVDAVIWPYPAEVNLTTPGREIRKATFPAGTAYIGVVWTEEAWPAVKGGAVTGYSLGGRGMRVQTGEVLPPMKR